MPAVRALLSIDDRAILGRGIHCNTEHFAYEDFICSINYQNRVRFACF